MTRGLPEPQQCLEDLQFATSEIESCRLAEKSGAKMVAQLVVHGSLWRLELAKNRLLCTRRKFGCDLFLRAPKNERTKAARQQGQCFSIGGPCGRAGED